MRTIMGTPRVCGTENTLNTLGNSPKDNAANRAITMPQVPRRHEDKIDRDRAPGDMLPIHGAAMSWAKASEADHMSRRYHAPPRS